MNDMPIDNMSLSIVKWSESFQLLNGMIQLKCKIIIYMKR